MPTLTPRPSSSPRTGRLLGAVVTVAALGIAASAAVLGITSAYGDHAEHAGHTASVAGAPAPAAAGGQDGQDGQDMAGMSGTGAPAAAGGGGAAQGGGGSMPGMGMPGMDSGGLALYAVQTGSLGVVATDGAGRLLYGSTGDANDPPTSRCTGACAQEWQPVVVAKGQQLDLEGVTPGKVGQVSRADGTTQLTLGGWPLYVNRADQGELKAAAPDAHGLWFVMTPYGDKIQV